MRHHGSIGGIRKGRKKRNEKGKEKEEKEKTEEKQPEENNNVKILGGLDILLA